MATRLKLHPLNSGTPQASFRGDYELMQADFELHRRINRHGQAGSLLQGGGIRLAISGETDALLWAWLFDPVKKENGEIIITDNHERVISKTTFTGALAVNFRIHFDARVRDGLLTIVTLEAESLATDKELYYEKGKPS